MKISDLFGYGSIYLFFWSPSFFSFMYCKKLSVLGVNMGTTKNNSQTNKRKLENYTMPYLLQIPPKKKARDSYVTYFDIHNIVAHSF